MVELQVPGLEHKDININVRDNVLEITGQRTDREEHKDKKRSYLVRESSTSFVRQVGLPRGADAENISAELDNGVLRVTISVERPEPKRIEIAAPKAKGAKKLTGDPRQKAETK
ncbi:MAG TPA: Hsp20/alpha crystallin family protein [Candidatus Limnocylindrales bacterium]|nr:Hsp20/alpha crystallin family protein [Candidatus Limnocylindrales bacterium]